MIGGGVLSDGGRLGAVAVQVGEWEGMELEIENVNVSECECVNIIGHLSHECTDNTRASCGHCEQAVQKFFYNSPNKWEE